MYLLLEHIKICINRSKEGNKKKSQLFDLVRKYNKRGDPSNRFDL